jgi:hypothetical protein
MSVRAANSARKNATFASLGESLRTGPGGASKKPACAGPGAAACRELSSSIFSRRMFSARSRASSAATAAGISVTPIPYANRSRVAHAGAPCGKQAGHGECHPGARSPARVPGLSWPGVK